MKNRLRFLPILCTMVLALSFSSEAQDESPQGLVDQGLKRYPVEKGTIEYTISGTQNGTEILYFDHWGWREAKTKLASMEMYGMNTDENTTSILEGVRQIQIDHKTKTGSIMVNPLLKSLAEGEKDLSATGEKMLIDMGGKMVGKETIAGKECKVFEVESLATKTWIWQGIPLKTHANLMGMEITTEATRVDFSSKISDEKFAVPADVKITPIGDIPGY